MLEVRAAGALEERRLCEVEAVRLGRVAGWI